MKNKWENYSLKDGKVQRSYVREYSSKSPKHQLKEEKLVYNPNNPSKREVNPEILTDAWTINLRKTDEDVRKENPSETHQEGRQGIQSSDQGRCEAQEGNIEIKTREEEKMKEKEKMSAKEKKHEAKEGKKYEKLEDKREAKKESKSKRK